MTAFGKQVSAALVCSLRKARPSNPTVAIFQDPDNSAEGTPRSGRNRSRRDGHGRARGSAPGRRRAARGKDDTSRPAPSRTEPSPAAPGPPSGPAHAEDAEPRSPPRLDGSAALLPPPAEARPPSPGAARGPGNGGEGRGAAQRRPRAFPPRAGPVRARALIPPLGSVPQR